MKRSTNNGLELTAISLSANQKLILRVLKDEFKGKAFGPQMLKETEDVAFAKLTINQITWNLLRLRESSLVKSEKKAYDGRILNEYSITEYVLYDAVDLR